MPGCAHPVYLAQSAPFDVDPGQLIFYDVIEPCVVARSSVLSCVAGADGEAKLPESVTVSDFRKWLCTVADSDDTFQSRPLAYMCAIIKVVPRSRSPPRPTVHVMYR